jgi:hypothetical protein
MQRRDFMTLVGGAAVMLPLAARAQKSTKMTRVGILATANPRSTSFYQAFELRLRDRSNTGTRGERSTGWLAWRPSWLTSTWT